MTKTTTTLNRGGEKLAAVLLERGWSPRKLARVLDCYDSSVIMWREGGPSRRFTGHSTSNVKPVLTPTTGLSRSRPKGRSPRMIARECEADRTEILEMIDAPTSSFPSRPRHLQGGLPLSSHPGLDLPRRLDARPRPSRPGRRR